MSLASQVGLLATRIATEIKSVKATLATKGNVSSTTITKIERITKANYDALATKDPNTGYWIVP